MQRATTCIRQCWQCYKIITILISIDKTLSLRLSRFRRGRWCWWGKGTFRISSASFFFFFLYKSTATGAFDTHSIDHRQKGTNRARCPVHHTKNDVFQPLSVTRLILLRPTTDRVKSFESTLGSNRYSAN